MNTVSAAGKALRVGDPGFKRDYSDDSIAVSEDSETAPSVLLSFLQATPDCVKIINCDGQLQFMNVNGLCAMEIDDFKPLKGAEWSTLWPAETRDRVNMAVRKASGGEPDRFEAFCPTAKGTDRWWDVTVTPITDEEGNVKRILSVSRDVTYLKQEQLAAQQHADDLEDDLLLNQELLDMQTTMMRAIDHRVRNSLSIIAGLLRIQASATDNDLVGTALRQAARRTAAVAAVKELLYRANRLNHANAKDFLPLLARQVIDSAHASGVELTTYVEPLDMDFSQATALGLILVEALENAIGHGFEPGQPANIRIRFGHSMEGDLKLEVENDGRGLKEGLDLDTDSGMGFRIIGLYADQLSGKTSLTNRPGGGTLFTFRYPKL